MRSCIKTEKRITAANWLDCQGKQLRERKGEKKRGEIQNKNRESIYMPAKEQVIGKYLVKVGKWKCSARLLLNLCYDATGK